VAAAQSSAGSGVGLAVGAITGAGIYVAGVVSGLVNIFSKTRLTVVPRVFLRDLSFYIISLLILLASSFTKGISKAFAGAFLGWYAVFIILVAIEDWREKRDKKKKEAAESEPEVTQNGLGEDLVDEKERKLSAWEQDNLDEEEAKKEYLKDLMRQKTNSAMAINKDDDYEDASDSEIKTSIYSADLPEEKDSMDGEGESDEDEDKRLKHVKHDLTENEE